MNIHQKYYNGILGPTSDLYEARYDDTSMIIQFNDRFWYDRELQYYIALKDKPYCYDMILVDRDEMTIGFKYRDANLNHILYENRDLEIDYKKEVHDILRDLESEGIKKINVYPHTFFMFDGQLKIMDLFGCTTEHTIIEENLLGGIINDENRFKFTNGYLDCSETYKYTLEHSLTYWPEGL